MEYKNRFDKQSKDEKRSNTQNLLADNGYGLCQFFGLKQRVGHPETFRKHALLLEYLKTVHDPNEGYYVNTKITPADLVDAYSYLDNKKEIYSWFNMAYEVGNILGMVDTLKFSTMFKDLILSVEVDTIERVPTKKILTVNTSWPLKRSFKSNSFFDSSSHINTTSTINTLQAVNCNEMYFNICFYETIHPLLVILKLACEKIVENYATFSYEEKFINALDKIDFKLKKIICFILKEIGAQSIAILEKETSTILQKLNPSVVDDKKYTIVDHSSTL